MDVRSECVEPRSWAKLKDLKYGDSFVHEGIVYMVVAADVDGSKIQHRSGYRLVVLLDDGELQTLHVDTEVRRVNAFEVVLKRQSMD